MKRLLLVILIAISAQKVLSQTTDLKHDHDSIQKVMEARMKVWEKQRRIYDRMYRENPYEAIDSVITQTKKDELVSGSNRLKAYQANNRLDTLKELDLSHAGLTEIPEFVYSATSMEVLILDYNDIKKLPKHLGKLPNLKRIYWRANKLDAYWWIRIQKMEGIEKLDISNNLLTRLPTGVKNLEGLEELVVDQNFLGEVPINRLSKAKSIRTVSFSKSHDLNIQHGDYSKLNFIEIFKVNKSGIKTLDPSVYQMAGLKELQLQENKLESISPGISQLENLKKLSFYKNQLSSLPPDLFEMDLQVIDLYYNNLEVIPEAIGNFQELEVLFLAHNRIYSLPESIGQLVHLEELYVHHNRLSVLPATLDNLTKLRVARVNDNYLTEFPTQLLELKQLVDLDVSNNQLTNLHPSVEKLPALELFSYHENPINFSTKANSFISPMIIRMLNRGVSCIPRIYKEEVSDSSGD